MNRKKLFLVMLVVGMLSLLVVSTPPIARSEHVASLSWITFTEAGAAEPNVFIKGEYGALWRVTPDSAIGDWDQPVYATAKEFNLDPLDVFDYETGPQVGPYAVGEELGLTLGEWLRAHGIGLYTVEDSMVSIHMSFENLIPSGLYTLWCIPTASSMDVEPAIESCNATDSEFAADKHGKMMVDVSFPTHAETDESSPAMLVLVWHRNSQVYGDSPGPLGYKTFIHLQAPISLTTE